MEPVTDALNIKPDIWFKRRYSKVSLLQASDGEKSDQDLVVDDASEVITKNIQGIYLLPSF
jgi:hypothetical protein